MGAPPHSGRARGSFHTTAGPSPAPPPPPTPSAVIEVPPSSALQRSRGSLPSIPGNAALPCRRRPRGMVRQGWKAALGRDVSCCQLQSVAELRAQSQVCCTARVVLHTWLVGIHIREPHTCTGAAPTHTPPAHTAVCQPIQPLGIHRRWQSRPGWSPGLAKCHPREGQRLALARPFQLF